jgi:hypothetical protein
MSEVGFSVALGAILLLMISVGGPVQVESSWTHSLRKRLVTQPLHLKCDVLASKFAFTFTTCTS